MPVISGPVGATGASGGAQLDYVERTSDSAGLAITSTSDGNSNGQQFIDGNAVTYDGSTRIKIEVYVPIGEITSGQSFILNLYDGTTDLGRIAVVSGPGGTNDQTMYGVRFLTPSAASHTYHIRAWKSGGTAKIFDNAGGASVYLPAWYRITKA
jgi:hypothetical protein